MHLPIWLHADIQRTVIDTHNISSHGRHGFEERRRAHMPALDTDGHRQDHQHAVGQGGLHRVQVIETQRYARFNVELKPGQTQQEPADKDGDQRIAPGPAVWLTVPGFSHRSSSWVGSGSGDASDPQTNVSAIWRKSRDWTFCMSRCASTARRRSKMSKAMPATKRQRMPIHTSPQVQLPLI